MTVKKGAGATDGIKLPGVKQLVDKAAATQRPMKVKASVKISVKPGPKAK